MSDGALRCFGKSNYVVSQRLMSYAIIALLPFLLFLLVFLVLIMMVGLGIHQVHKDYVDVLKYCLHYLL